MKPLIAPLPILLALLPLLRYAAASAPLPYRTPPPLRRQDASTASSSLPLFPTITASSASPTETPTPSTSSGSSHEFIITKTLEVADKPIPLAATVGLIMPNPYDEIFVEVGYNLGFVDVVPRPAPTIGGWLRLVTPLLILPDYAVNVFPNSGTADPGSALAIPPASGGLCGATGEDYPVSYPFIFHRPGWYMFVVNQTFIQPTVTNSTCGLPLVSQKSFFATHLLSLSPLPTGGPIPRAPTSTYTLFAELSTNLPDALPLEEHTVSSTEKLGIGLGVTGAVLAFAGCVGLVLYVRSRRKAKREIIAFNRLKPHDQAQFLADNPDHFLNPYRKAGRAGVDGWGRPVTGWRGWGRWNQGGGWTGWGGRAGQPGQPGWGGADLAGQGVQEGYGWGGVQEGMRQVYNVPSGQAGMGVMGAPGPGLLPLQQPLMVWPTGQQGGYGYR